MEYNCAMYVSQIRQMTIRALNQILKKHNITLFNAEQSKILEFLWQEDNLNPKNLVSVNNNDMIVSQLKAGIGLSLISKRFINENIAFQNLGERYQRIFYGLSFLSEQDKLLKTVIKKIKNLSEF